MRGDGNQQSMQPEGVPGQGTLRTAMTLHCPVWGILTKVGMLQAALECVPGFMLCSHRLYGA